MGHRSLDPVKVSRNHHAQEHFLVRLVNLDALLLKKGPQHQSVPEVGALNRPRHVHNSDTPLLLRGGKRDRGRTDELPAIGRVRESGQVVAVAVPVPGDEHAGGAITTVRELPVSSRSPPYVLSSPT